jgi:signal transduction histidine kinase
MRPSSRHLYPQWLRPGTARDGATGSPTGRAGTAEGPELLGAWRVWERVQAFDRRYGGLVDIALAAVLFVLCSGAFFTPPGGSPNLLVIAALTFPLAFRRRAPMTVFLVVAAVAFVQWLVSGSSLADASLLVAVYTVALESEWVLVAVAAVILEAGVVMATVRWNPGDNDGKSFVFLTGLAIAAILAGIVVRALRSQLAWLAERAERLELERDQQASLATAAERARIAREMHDVVSHNIQVMVTLADAAAAQAADPARAAEAMQEVSNTGRQALTDMRRLLGVLREERPAGATGATGAARATPPERPSLAPQPGLGELDALAERVRGTGLAVSVERAGRPFETTDAAGLTVYRIVQEALTNALKHADDPASVEVHLEFRDPDITVRVHDDGGTKVGVRRLEAPALGPQNGLADRNGHGQRRHGNESGGHGVAGMAERAAAFGGTLEAGPAPAGGWDVTATLRDCRAPAGR